jgi:hypothetical protein
MPLSANFIISELTCYIFYYRFSDKMLVLQCKFALGICGLVLWLCTLLGLEVGISSSCLNLLLYGYLVCVNRACCL